MTQWTFEATARGYASMWRTITIKGGQDAKSAETFARKIIAAEARYKGVQARTGVPWYFIGALHMRESSCNFAGVLHNGEHIIGTGRKTTLVPAGRGPFGSWEEAAEDALELKNLQLIKEWSAARMGFEAERFNGFGYIGKGVNSPYVWAGSNHEQLGKYVRDGVFDRSADDTQLGVMTVIKRLCELREDIAKDLADAPAVSDEPDTGEPGTPPTTPQVPIEIGVEKLVLLALLAIAIWPQLEKLMSQDDGMPERPATQTAPTSSVATKQPSVIEQLLPIALPLIKQLLFKDAPAVVAAPPPAPPPAPAKNTTGVGVGITGVLGVVVAAIFGWIGVPLPANLVGDSASSIAQLLLAIFGGTAALGQSGTISWLIDLGRRILAPKQGG